MAVWLAVRAAAGLLFIVEAEAVGDDLISGVLGRGEVAEARSGGGIRSGALVFVSGSPRARSCVELQRSVPERARGVVAVAALVQDACAALDPR